MPWHGTLDLVQWPCLQVRVSLIARTKADDKDHWQEQDDKGLGAEVYVRRHGTWFFLFSSPLQVPK